MIALVLALLTLVASATRAENIVCDNVSSELRTFGLVTDTLVTKLGSSGYPLEPWGTSIYRRACTRRGKMAATVMYPLFVATESAGAAIRFTHGTIAGSTCWNQVEGERLDVRAPSQDDRAQLARAPVPDVSVTQGGPTSEKTRPLASFG